MNRSPKRSSDRSIRRMSMRSLPMPTIISRSGSCDVAAAWLYRRNCGEFRRQCISGIGRNLIFSECDQRHADIRLSRRAVDDAGCRYHLGAQFPKAFDRLADRKAGRDDVFDDDDASARFDLEAAQAELASLALDPNRRHAEVARCLVGGDQTADGRSDHVVDAAWHALANQRGQRAAQPLGLVGMHEDARLLQEDGTAQTGGQNEVAGEDRARLPENIEDFVSIHRPSNLPNPAHQPFTRLASETLELSRNCDSSRLSCFRSHTSRSMIISVKSGAVRSIDSMWILASLAATTWSMLASEPGSLIAVTEMRAGKRSFMSSSISQRTSIHRSGWSSKAVSEGDWIG